MAQRQKGTSRGKNRSRRRRNKEDLSATLDWFLPSDSIFSEVQPHGNTKWHPKSLAFLGLTWAWSDSKNVTDAYAEAKRCCEKISHRNIPRTYQGFMGALSRWSSVFIGLLCVVLRKCMQKIGGKFWRIDGWVPIAFDGSRSTAPRTVSNEKAFCAANYGKGKTAKYRKKKSKGMRRKKNEKNPAQPQAPQAWITLLWHLGLRLPWSWRLGPSNSSERAHVMEMVQTGTVPRDTLFCGDAGFIGYDLWKTILDHGGDFLVRVGGNVSLLAESSDYERLHDGLVLCWPKAKMDSGKPPLRLRLVKARIGKTKMFLLTSVLSSTRLSPQQMVRYYKMRWGVEVEFRGLKQTLDRAKLRCRNERRLLAELDWSILGMAVAELLALKEQRNRRAEKSSRNRIMDPSKRSLAESMRALRRCVRYTDDVPEPGEDLANLLAKAVTDGYQRKSSKKARYRPPNPDKKPLGEPKIRKLSPEERKRMRKHATKRAK